MDDEGVRGLGDRLARRVVPDRHRDGVSSACRHLGRSLVLRADLDTAGSGLGRNREGTELGRPVDGAAVTRGERDRDAVVAGPVDLEVVELPELQKGRRLLRSTATVGLDVDHGRCGRLGGGRHVDERVVTEADLRRVDHAHHGATGVPNRCVCTSGSQGRGLDPEVRTVGRAPQLELHVDVRTRLDREVTGVLDVLLVANLHDLLAHRHLAADVVEAGLYELAVPQVEGVTVLLSEVVEHQHGVVREAPFEADSKLVLLAGVPDAGSLLQYYELGALGLLVDHLGAVRIQRLHLDARSLA